MGVPEDRLFLPFLFRLLFFFSLFPCVDLLTGFSFLGKAHQKDPLRSQGSDHVLARPRGKRVAVRAEIQSVVWCQPWSRTCKSPCLLVLELEKLREGFILFQWRRGCMANLPSSTHEKSHHHHHTHDLWPRIKVFFAIVIFFWFWRWFSFFPFCFFCHGQNSKYVIWYDPYDQSIEQWRSRHLLSFSSVLFGACGFLLCRSNRARGPLVYPSSIHSSLSLSLSRSLAW